MLSSPLASLPASSAFLNLGPSQLFTSTRISSFRNFFELLMLNVMLSRLRSAFRRLGPVGKFFDEMLERWVGVGDAQRLKIPQAKGSIGAVGGQAFFIPLYELFITYGGIFRLTFGPKVIIETIKCLN